MFGTNSFKTLLAAGALVLAAGAASAATVTYQTAESDPKVQLVIDDSIAGKFRFTLTTVLGFADFLGLGFDFAGAEITSGMLTRVSYTPDTSNEPELLLFGNNTDSQVLCGGNGCNFNGGGGSDPLPYDYIIRIGENGAGDNLVSSVVFDIAVSGSLANNPFSGFGVRAQSTSNGGSIKYGLVETPPVPVPAAGFLMIGALGGLAALRRRRRAV